MPAPATFISDDVPSTFVADEPTEPKVELNPYEKLRIRGVGPGLSATAGPVGTQEEAADIFASLAKPPVTIPRIEGTTIPGKIGAGIANVAGGMFNAMASPLGIATLGLGGSELGAAALKGVFGGLMAKEAGKTLGEASVSGDPQAYTEGILAAGLAPAIALPRITSLKERIPNAPKERYVQENIPVERPGDGEVGPPGETGGGGGLQPETRVGQEAQVPLNTTETPKVSTLDVGGGINAVINDYGDSVEVWYHNTDGDRVGQLKASRLPTGQMAIEEHSLFDEGKGHGYGGKLVRELGRKYGEILSDTNLSESAEKMWDRLGAKKRKFLIGDEEQWRYEYRPSEVTATTPVSTGVEPAKPEPSVTTPVTQPGVELRHAGIPIPGSEKFVEEDIKPFAKAAADTVVETAQQVKSLLAPPTMGPEAKLSAGIIRERKAELAQTDEQMRVKFDENRKALDKLTPQQSLDFINRMERGLPQATPELNTLQSSLRNEFDTRVGQVRSVNPNALQHLIQDYFPHLWKDPNAAMSWYQRILGRRPLRGPASFLKRRSIPTTADGVNAGLEPISWNPIDLSLLKFHEMDRYVMGQKIFQEFKDKGLAQFSRSDIAPEGYARINDRVANVIEYRPTTKASGLPGAPERVLRGHWYVQEDAARVLNNFLSPGLERFKWFRALRWFGNTLNMAQLGLSGYHLTFTMIDSGTSKLSLGIEQVAQGKPKGVITMGRGIGGTVLANQLEAYLKGNKVLEEYTKPGSVGGDYGKIVDALLAGGGRTSMPRIFRNNSMENFFKALRSGNYPGAVVRAPFAAIEAVSYPLMQNIVPRLKLGVFSDMALNEIDRMGPGVTREEFRATMGKVWDSVDNRMGEMVYDNLFWNKTLKDLSFLAVRAVGWNLGTLRELGGGVVDSATVIKRIREGDPAVTRRMAYLMSLPITVGMMGAMYQYMKTGKGPEELRDYIYPKTGKTLPDGTPERVNFPSYLKDVGSYARHPFTTLANKLHPTWSTLDQMWRNKDYYGTQIRNPDDPLVKQVQQELQFLGHTFIPFSFKGAQRRVGAKESPEVKAESFFGVMPIPTEVARTTAENKIMDYGIAKLPQGARTPEAEQRSQLKRDLESQLQSPSDYQGAQAEIRKMAKDGKLSKGQATYENSKLKFEQDQIRTGKTKAQAQWMWRFKHLSLDEALTVYEVATPEEKRLFFRELRAKELKAR